MVCLRCLWCVTGLSAVLKVFVLDIYDWRQVRPLKKIKSRFIVQSNSDNK